MEKIPKPTYSALILGATGETGKCVLNELLNSSRIERVMVLGRRNITELVENPKVTQKVIDFDNLNENDFANNNLAFICLGSTRMKHGSETFRKVDYEYVVNSASYAKKAGIQHLSLVSATGANYNSWFLYSQVKGQSEEALKKMNFERLSIFRPAFLQCDRKEHRLGEKIYREALDPIVSWIFPRHASIQTTKLGKAIVLNVFSPPKGPIEVFENSQIHDIVDKYVPEEQD